MRHLAALPVALLGLVAVTAVTGCKPDYPTCETDADCKDKEFCVARKCQQCRNANDCGEGQECQAGKCAAIPGYCTDRSQCPEGQDCIANRCKACADDAECPSGLRCLAGRCEKAECKTNEDCPQDKDCVNGACVAVAPPPPTGPPCPLATVYFAFDSSTLTSEATNTLATNAACLKKAERPVTLSGHCDPRGTDEYNLALSERRAQTVRDYLQRMGIPAERMRTLPRGALDATGTDETGWSRDRRVDSEWQ